MLAASAGLGVSGAQTSAEVKEHLRRELARSKPDYVAYVPGSYDGSTGDWNNEHFLVFDGPDGSMMAVWTQSDKGGSICNRIMFQRSDDEGVTWSAPVRIVGPVNQKDPAHMASWAFPMVSKRGRIYVIYNQNTGSMGWVKMHTGKMAGIYSDDNGKTWSKGQFIDMPVSQYDDPAGKVPAEWIVWQNPMRDRKGGFLVGYTHWLHPERCRRRKVLAWTEHESVVEFMRFTNSIHCYADPFSSPLDPDDVSSRPSGGNGLARERDLFHPVLRRQHRLHH